MTPREGGGIHISLRARLLFGAAAVFALLVVPVAVAGAGGDGGGTQATASASVKKKINKLKEQVGALTQQLGEVQGQLAALQDEQGGGRPPTGVAGGDLTGRYPNPAIDANAIGTGEVVNNTLTDVDLAASAQFNGAQAGGGLEGTYPDQVFVAPNGVGGGNVVDSSLTTFDVVNNNSPFAISTSDLAIPAAHVFNFADQSIANVTPTILAFDSERYDTAAMHDTVTNNSRLKAPVTGIYEITAQAQWAVTSTANDRTLSLIKNGATTIARDDADASGCCAHGQEITTQVRLQTNDYVEVEVVQNSGGLLAVRGVNDFTPEFSMVWVAPGP